MNLNIPWCTSEVINNMARYFRMPSQSGQPVRKDQAKGCLQDLPDVLLTYWSEASSEWGNGTCTLGNCPKISLKYTTCSAAGGREPAMWTWDLGTYCTLLQIILVKGNAILYRMEMLLTQTIETDTPGFHPFGKWWLRKRYVIFWQQ